MEPTLFRFALKHSRRQQIILLVLIAASYPFVYYSLDLPKTIIDMAIAGEGGFPKRLFGFELDQIPYLMTLSVGFLGLVLINGAFKYVINTFKGRLNERMLRRLRYSLYAQILRFPLPHFRRTSTGEIISMITAETEPVGNFIGEAIAQPAQQGGMLLVYLSFIFVQDPVLGTAAVALYPFQGWLIPRLQRKVNQLGKLRVRLMRSVSDRVGESIAGIQEIRSNDAAAWHLADVSHRLGDIYDVRFEIYQRKFFIKFLNNFINQLTPFFFYSIGGYLVIKGTITFGALVAVLAAYKDLAGPWKELLDWYQQKEDVRVKYEQIVEQFQPAGVREAPDLDGEPEDDRPLDGPINLANVSIAEDTGRRVVEDLSLEIPAGRHVAVISTGGGATELAMMLAGLLPPSGGRVQIGDRDLYRLPAAVTGRRIAYVGPTAYLLTATVRDNLIYGLRHRPLRPARYDAQGRIRRRRRAMEAAAAGNADFDINADWVDYKAAGCSSPAELEQRLLDVLDTVDLTADVYALGLHGRIDPVRHPDAAKRILEARAAVQAHLEEPALAQLVERFDPGRYNTNASVAENLLFGSPIRAEFAHDNLATHPYTLQVLDRTGLTDDFLRMGVKMAETMVELFADLPPGHEFFERFSFISAEDLPAFQPIIQRVARDGLGALTGESRDQILRLPFKMVVARHRLGLLDAAMQARILEARRVFARDLPDHLKGAVAFFRPDRYNPAATLQDNILFGKVAYGQPQVGTRIGGLLAAVVEQLHLRLIIVSVGLDMPVGIGGSRLSAAQRQKVLLARALLKNPDFLVLNEATAGLDGASQAVVHTMALQARKGRGLVWFVHRPSMARHFDRVLVLQNGQLVANGTFDEVTRPGTPVDEVIGQE
ncbi:MAG TPA: ABC transporter ATP-binding protein [Azospirillaceae bacterium]|nr:ABC transporter ATP-binding protein [Azospirillaceae bacterium]